MKSDLKTAAQQALTEMANARDYIWLLDEGGTGVSEEEILNKIANAITALRAALAEPDRKPLNEDQMNEAYINIWRNLPDGFGHTASDWIDVGVRYAERVHGIGGNDE